MADIFRRFGLAYLSRVTMTPKQAKVLRNVSCCRTSAFGGHKVVCPDCGKFWLHHNSCFDRHCPTCQGSLAAVWTSERLERVVPTHHFHTVATVPEELRPLALANPAVVYALLFKAVTQTLLELARSHWNATPGVTAVLHTWTRQMTYHPHLHCIVTGGGLSADGARWVPCRPGFLFPVKVLSALIRGKFMDGLVEAYDEGRLHFAGTSARFADPAAFADLRRILYAANWVVYAKRPFGGPEQVIRYLARYTHRVAISSSRLVSVTDDAVVFRTHAPHTCRVRPDEFIRRFLLHTLPKGFRKIRHYGLLAPANVAIKLPRAQRLAAALGRHARRASPDTASSVASIPRSRPQPGDICPACGVGVLVRQPLPSARAPPVSP